MERTVRMSSFIIQACQTLSTSRIDLTNQTMIIMRIRIYGSSKTVKRWTYTHQAYQLLHHHSRDHRHHHSLIIPIGRSNYASNKLQQQGMQKNLWPEMTNQLGASQFEQPRRDNNRILMRRIKSARRSSAVRGIHMRSRNIKNMAHDNNRPRDLGRREGGAYTCGCGRVEVEAATAATDAELKRVLM